MSRPSSFSLTFSFSGIFCVRNVPGAAFALVLSAAACGDDNTGPEGPTLTGAWTDTIQEVDGNTFDFQIRLTQPDSSVGGTYSLTVGLPLGSGSVMGTNSLPEVRSSFPRTANLLGSSLATRCTYTARVNAPTDVNAGYAVV